MGSERGFRGFQVAALVLVPVLLALVSLCLGRMLIPVTSVFKAVFGSFDDIRVYRVLWGIRLPRILLAVLVGAGLSVSGLVLQSLFSNALATPDTIGVASGASFGACLALLMGASMIGMQILALAFGLMAVALTYLGGRGRGRGTSSIVLSGIMIASLFNALVSLVKYVADAETQLPSITYWLMGSLSGKGYRTVLFGLPVILLGSSALLALRWRLNVLPLSDDEARTSGTDIARLRIVAVVCATAMTASCVSMCGQVGWVGLLVPHMCRMMFGSDSRRLVPASISVGASFMVVVDTLARTMTASELPISILTAVIGAPVFIYLMRRKGAWTL